MQVRVDEARHDNAIAAVDALCVREAPAQWGALVDGSGAAIADGNGKIAARAAGIEGENVAALEQQGGRVRSVHQGSLHARTRRVNRRYFMVSRSSISARSIDSARTSPRRGDSSSRMA